MATRSELGALRRQRGWTQQGLANEVGVTVDTVKAWDSGRRSPQPTTRPLVANALGVSLHELAVLLNETAAPNGQAVPQWLTLYASLEQGASRLWTWQPVTLHALLQTADYAAAVERIGPRAMTEEAVEHRVDLRLARQAVITRRDHPLHLSVVLDESVLYRVTGSEDVMVTQLGHLAETAQLANIEIRVLPLAEGVHSGGTGAFTLLASTGDTAQLVCLMDRIGVRYLEDPTTIEAYDELFWHLREHSLNPVESIALIDEIKERYS